MSSGNGEEDSLSDRLQFPKRRGLLKTLGVGAAAGLAGCSGGNNNTTTQPTTEDTTTTTQTTTQTTTTTTQEPQRQVLGDYVNPDGTGVTSLFWVQVADAPTANRVGLTMDGLYALREDQSVFPLWGDISTDDGRVYEITLRENLQWGKDYGQMTAEDWVYTIKRIFQGENNWAGFTSRGDFLGTNPDTGKEEPIPVEKTGKYSFEFQKFEVDPAFAQKPVFWGRWCLPKGLAKQYVPDQNAEAFKKDEEIQTLSYAGNLGPYDFKTWEREAKFVASRSDEYYMQDVEGGGKFDNVTDAWRGAPYFNSYTYRVIPEESQRLAALKEGEVTSAGIPETKVQQYEDISDINVVVSPQPFNSLIIYNQRANGNFYQAFRKQPVRVALSQAVNKQQIVENILRGYGQVAHTFQPKFSKWYTDDQIVTSGVPEADRPYDPEAARSKLDSALGGTKYEYDGDTVVDTEAGEDVQLRLVYPVGTETTKTTVEFIKQQYEQNLGLGVSLKGVKFNTLLGKYAQTSYKKSLDPNSDGQDWSAGPYNQGSRNEAVSAQPWDLQFGIIFNTYPRTPSSTRPFWIKDGSVNYFGYEPKADLKSLYDEASQTVEESARKEIYAEIFGVLSREQPCNFTNMGVSIAGYQNYVEGPEPEFGSGWDATTWYFNPEEYSGGGSRLSR